MVREDECHTLHVKSLDVSCDLRFKHEFGHSSQIEFQKTGNLEADEARIKKLQVDDEKVVTKLDVTGPVEAESTLLVAGASNLRGGATLGNDAGILSATLEVYGSAAVTGPASVLGTSALLGGAIIGDPDNNQDLTVNGVATVSREVDAGSLRLRGPSNVDEMIGRAFINLPLDRPLTESIVEENLTAAIVAYNTNSIVLDCQVSGGGPRYSVRLPLPPGIPDSRLRGIVGSTSQPTPSDGSQPTQMILQNSGKNALGELNVVFIFFGATVPETATPLSTFTYTASLVWEDLFEGED